MDVPEIPERLEKAIIFLRGEDDGRTWLAALPSRMASYADRWDLQLHEVAEGGAMSCCVYCSTPDGTPAVLKIPVDETAGRSEALLLDHWASSSASPDVLHRDNESGVFLMSRILPGATAWAAEGPEDSRRFGDLLTRLNPPDAPPAPSLKDLADIAEMRLDWARDRFADPRYANDVASIKDAETVLSTLLATTTTHHVLHADLQAKNILTSPNHWHAIDPMGATGDINAEAALWIAIQDGPTTIEDRLTELSPHPLLSPPRLRAWTYVLATAEYRPYLPPSAVRIEGFLSQRAPAELTACLR
ncbi:streptomycin 6-kinase [Actinocorallia herbida]|uniref:Streptomycin 6-kinase n=1 Tax=Actinocorallia herbida TaxID=58109 RepID=A0A3N1CQC1_9ACTN|nr:aminoglycoside phosphotransferase family protein [Actinocorallia herbida]ROO82918.1 streptomycin 6-kinase [Actinocorallia herbida]